MARTSPAVDSPTARPTVFVDEDAPTADDDTDVDTVVTSSTVLLTATRKLTHYRLTRQVS